MRLDDFNVSSIKTAIDSESGRFFTILSANPGGIVGSFIHKFVCCLWMSKTCVIFNHFSFKTCAIISVSEQKWILFFRQNIWRENQASQPGKPLK